MGRKISQARNLPRLPRLPAVRGRTRAKTARYPAGRSVSDDPRRTDRFGGHNAGFASRRNAALGAQHLRVILDDGQTPDGSETWVSDAGSGILPPLSTGERQRMQLALAVRSRTTGILYVLDEPSPSACIHWICERFCGCFRHSSAIDSGATVIVIKHDLDIIRNADYIIDMGSGDGEAGGRIVATGTPEDVRCIAESVTGKFI